MLGKMLIDDADNKKHAACTALLDRLVRTVPRKLGGLLA